MLISSFSFWAKDLKTELILTDKFLEKVKGRRVTMSEHRQDNSFNINTVRYTLLENLIVIFW